MTQTLEKTFREASKLSDGEQDILASIIHDHLAVLTALRKGLKAADRGEVVLLEEVKK